MTITVTAPITNPCTDAPSAPNTRAPRAAPTRMHTARSTSSSSVRSINGGNLRQGDVMTSWIDRENLSLRITARYLGAWPVSNQDFTLTFLAASLIRDAADRDL